MRRANPAIHTLTPKQRKMVNDLERLWLEGEAMAGVAHDLGDEEGEDYWLAQAEEAQAALTEVADELEEIATEDKGERGLEENFIGGFWYEGAEQTPYELLRRSYDNWVREYAFSQYGYDVRNQYYQMFDDDPDKWLEAMRGMARRRVTNKQIVDAASAAWLEWRKRLPQRLRDIELEARTALLRRQPYAAI